MAIIFRPCSWASVRRGTLSFTQILIIFVFRSELVKKQAILIGWAFLRSSQVSVQAPTMPTSDDDQGNAFTKKKRLEQPTRTPKKIEKSDLFQNNEWVEQTPYIFNDGASNLPADLPPVTLEEDELNLALVVALPP